MKKKQTQRQTVDSIEAIKDLGSDIKKSFSEAGKGVVSDLWEQMLGTEAKPSSPASEADRRGGDLKPGEELVLQKREQLQRVEPAINYAREIVQAERNIRTKESQEIRVRIQEIQIELKKLTKTSRELEIEFKDVTMETLPVKPGKFHLNFFEWVLSQIRRARMRIEDSAHWTALMKSKRSQKQYWSLFKKHGTSFGLSGERIVATQVG